MERHEMETRLRQTLAERADDVTPSPELWERVADSTVRRSRWRSPAVWGGLAAAAAAIVVAVVVVPGLLDTPPSVDIADQPPTGSTTPTETDAGPVTGTEGVRVVVGRGGENAIGGQGALVEVDPASGQDERVLAEGQPGIDAPAYSSMDLRPGSGELAAMVMVEGQWDIRLLDADGLLDRAFIADPTFEEGEEHHVAWSQDGAYLVWTSTPDDGDGTIVHLLDVDLWRASPVVDDPFGARDLAQRFEVEELATAATELFDVVGVRGDELLILTSAGDLLLQPQEGCDPFNRCPYAETAFRSAVSAPGRLDVADSDLNLGAAVGPQYVLDAGPDSAAPFLIVESDGDLSDGIELPEGMTSTDAPIETAWLEASGERVLVGRGGRAWLLTVDLDAAPPTVVDTVEFAGGDVVTGAVAVDREPESGDDDLPDDRTPTADPGTGSSAPDAADTAEVVVTPDEVTGGFVLTGDDLGTVTVPKPDELLAEQQLSSVAVRPGAANGDVEVISSWFVGDGASRVLTVVRDGEVVRNESLPSAQDSSAGGGIAETPDDTPVFSPDGSHLFWLEGSTSGNGIRMVAQRWDENGPVGSGSGPTVAGVVARTAVPLPLEDGVTGFRVEAVARDGNTIVVFASTWRPGPTAARTPSMLRVTMPIGIEGGVAASNALVSRVELPGVLVGGGVTRTGDLDDAVGLVETEGGLLLVGLRDPRELVELDTADLAQLDPAYGLLVAVSRDGAVLRLTDGGFRLVSLDGETRELDLPRGTLTFG